MIQKFFILLLIIFINNCATSNAGIATSNIPVVNRKYQNLGPVEGKKGWITFDIAIVGVPLQEPPIKELVDQLIKEKEADALVNIKYWSDKMVFPLFTYNRLGISAEAIKFEDEGPSNAKKNR